jgi:predicted transcriptional regulator
MDITKEMRDRAQVIIGDAAKDMDAPALLSALIEFGDAAMEKYLELSNTVTEFSAAQHDDNPQPTIELSAGVRKLIAEGLAAKVSKIADTLHLSQASRAMVEEYFTSDDVIALSAVEGDEPALPAKFLDLLSRLEVTKLSRTEKTKAQIGDEITLSRAADDHDDDKPAASAWDDVIQHINRE